MGEWAMPQKLLTLASVSIIILCSACSQQEPRAQNTALSQSAPSTQGSPPQIIRTEALDNPSKHAWDLFLYLNHPALDPKLGQRGAPDLSKPMGAPGTTTVWETWRAATPEVFREMGLHLRQTTMI